MPTPRTPAPTRRRSATRPAPRATTTSSRSPRLTAARPRPWSTTTPFSDWKSLFGPIMPDHIAKANGGDQTKAQLAAATTYFSKTVPTWSSGPYVISKFEKNTAVTEVPNPKWYGDTPPGYKTLVFRILTDATTEAPALKSGEVQAINPQPEIDLVKAVQSQKGVLYHIGSGLIWEHFDLNLKNKALQNAAVRNAHLHRGQPQGADRAHHRPVRPERQVDGQPHVRPRSEGLPGQPARWPGLGRRRGGHQAAHRRPATRSAAASSCSLTARPSRRSPVATRWATRSGRTRWPS